MNLTKMREFRWVDYLPSLFTTYKNNLTWGDQDIINILFHYYPGTAVTSTKTNKIIRSYSSCDVFKWFEPCSQINCTYTHADITIELTTVCIEVFARMQKNSECQLYMDLVVHSTIISKVHFKRFSKRLTR